MYDTGIQDLAQKTTERQKQAQDLIGSEVLGADTGTGLLGNFADSLEQRAQDATAKQAASQKLLSDLFNGIRSQGDKSGQEVSDLLKSYGLNLDNTVYMPQGVNAGNFIKAAQQANVASVVSPEERARYLTLQRLAGNSNPTLLTGKEEVGGFDPNSIFNRDEFNRIQQETGQRFSSDKTITKAQQDIKSTQDRIKEMEHALATGQTEYDWDKDGTPDIRVGTNPEWQFMKSLNNLRNEALPSQTEAYNKAMQPYGKTTLQDLINKYMTAELQKGGTGGKIGLL
jgi:hypothetical protein